MKKVKAKTDKPPSKMDQIFNKLGITSKTGEDNIVTNLTKAPKKDKGVNMPNTLAGKKHAVHQMDLLFLPEDDGYRYALVVVDVATRAMDAEP